MLEVQQAKFFLTPPTDIDREGLVIGITDDVAEFTGIEFVSNVRDRDPSSLWSTTGSDDSGNTVLTFTFGSMTTFNHFIFGKHNWKDFTLEFFNGVAFSVLEDVTDFDKDYYEFVSEDADGVIVDLTGTIVRVTIHSTQIADSDKVLGIIFFGEIIGQLEGWPIINADLDYDFQTTKTLSNKYHVVSGDGSISYSFKTRVTSIQHDFDILTSLFKKYREVGFFVQASGGNSEQFKLDLPHFDPSYIPKMKPMKNYMPDLYKGIYSCGASFDASFVEVL